MATTVELKEYNKTLPTYLVEEGEKNTIFGNYDGDRSYPYVKYDKVEENKTNVDYKMISLENEYIKVEICTDLGGRIFSAYNKVSKRHLFYHNPVVKPVQIGIVGAWIMSGVENNYPVYGHSPIGMLPVLHKTGENEDGSKWIRVGTLDRFYGLRCNTTYTLHLGSSAIDIEHYVYNPTSTRKSLYHWSNAAIEGSSESQLYLPTNIIRDQTFKTYGYPKDKESGRGFDKFDDYHVDMDAFALATKEEAFGVYNPQDNSGLVHWSPLDEMPGKKFFTWGKGGWMDTWVNKTTDNGNDYYEIQAGITESQQDFKFIDSKEAISYRERWFSADNVDGFKYLSGEFAINIKEKNLLISTCRTFKNLEIEIITKESKRSIKNFNIKPEIVKTIILENKLEQENLTEIKIYNNNKLIMFWDVNKFSQVETKLPERASRKILKPKNSNEYNLSGMEWEKAGNYIKAEEAYVIAIEKDSNNIDALVSYSRILLSKGQYQKALKLLENNNKNDEMRFIESQIYFETKEDELASKSILEIEDRKKYHIEILLMECKILIRKKKFKRALELTKENNTNPEIVFLHTYLDNELQNNDKKEIQSNLDMSLELLSLEYLNNRIDQNEFIKAFNTDIQKVIEIVNMYIEIGDFKKAQQILNLFKDLKATFQNENKFELLIYSAYIELKTSGNKDNVNKIIDDANLINIDYTLAYKKETILIIKELEELKINNNKCNYLLGNIYSYLNRKEEALDVYKKAKLLGLEYGPLDRNIANLREDFNYPVDEINRYYLSAVNKTPGSIMLQVEYDEFLCKSKKFSEAKDRLLNLPNYIKNDGIISTRISYHYARNNEWKKIIDSIKNSNLNLSEWIQVKLELYREAAFRYAMSYLGVDNKKGVSIINNIYAVLPKNLQLKSEMPLSNSLGYYALLMLGETKDWQGRSIKDEIKNVVIDYEVYTDSKFYYSIAKCLEITGLENKAKEVYIDMLDFSRRCKYNYTPLEEKWDLIDALAKFGQKENNAEKLLKMIIKNSIITLPFVEFELNKLEKEKLLLLIA